MNSDILGLIISFLYVFTIIIFATLIQKVFKFSTEFSRKIIHVLVGNWIFIALYYFHTWYVAVIGPASFILINYLSYRFNIFKAMELDEKNPGTVYYAISLTILTLITFGKSGLYFYPFLGIMAMTWGDGFAAVIGKKIPITKIRESKSLGGSLAFIIFTFISSIVYLLTQNIDLTLSTIITIAFIVAIVGAIVEIYSPTNFDNLTVPLTIGILGLLWEINFV